MAEPPPKPRPLTAARIVGVVLGGPALCVIATGVAAAHAGRSLRARRRPCPAAIAVLGAAAGYAASVPWLRGWGATPAERAGPLPGDETVPAHCVQHTRAVAIDAPAGAVWPWLVQIGQDRAGFYSYTWLENLAGCRMRNSDRLVPAWQARGLGDTLLLHPEAGYEIVGFEPGRSLALDVGWYFVVEPDGPSASRLLARWRFPPGLDNLVFALLFELPHFVMERQMLLGIKQRAEAAARA